MPLCARAAGTAALTVILAWRRGLA